MKLSVTAITLLFGSSLALADEAANTLDASGEVDAADVASNKLRVGAFLGGNYLSSENELGNSYHPDQVPGSGFLLGGQASYQLATLAPDSSAHPVLHGEIEGRLLFSSTDSTSMRNSESAPVLGWRGNVLLDLFGKDKVTPFALLGLGGETVFGADRFMSTPDTDFAMYLGGGARYSLNATMDLRADARVGWTASRRDDYSALAEFHLGVGWHFGQGKTEPKTIVVVKEKEPTALDTDGDGIDDMTDTCPKLPETFNEIDDEDGCPEEDSDGDGLLGSRDQCPAAAEDRDGFQDDDGCPESDNDGDGFDDGADKCPDQAETVNNFEDSDGCPDEVPEDVQEFVGTIEGIVFRTGSAKIKKSSEAVLMRALAVLTEHPELRIEISGHTDDRGSAERNRSLSQKRADYVKYFLVDKGVAADRIESIGKGPDAPVADNGTAEGRAKNRRIEFRLLK